MKFDILNRFTGAIQFTAEITCSEDTPPSIKLGLAVRAAVAARAYLAGAYLARADLAGAYLARADLARADLADAYLAGANLAGANLAGANLAGADLARADLARADLADAYLAGANLAGANLAGANLADANLADAYLAGAKWRDGITITKPPIVVHGLTPYRVVILDQHMQIGCELHSLFDWEAFSDRGIIEMDGRAAANFWRDHKAPLLGLARASGRSFEPVRPQVAA